MESDNDSYYEESSDAEEVAGSLHININVNINESPESPPPPPESPSLVPPPTIPEQELSPGWELPDDGNNFMNLFTRADVVELKNWVQESRKRINEEGYVVEVPTISQNFMVFLQEQYGQQWEVKFLRPAAEPLSEQLLRYVVGYVRLTSHNKNLFRGLF